MVFPGADVKVYLTASPEERARRRHDEAPEGVARRDRIDSTRDASPLREADGRPPARYDRTDRARCGRGGAVVAVSTRGPRPRVGTWRQGPGRRAGTSPSRSTRAARRSTAPSARLFVTALWAWFRPKVVGARARARDRAR